MNSIRQKNNRKGFTLAELMIAVAIIVILAGVAFIGVAGYLRSMAQLERDGLAKEIFFAAQNHLTMEEGQGFLTVKKEGGKTSASAADPGSKIGDDYYYVVNAKDITSSTFAKTTMLGIMLPFGSVDETVRAGGNYIIHYQLNPARVLDVFYCKSAPARFSGEFRFPMGPMGEITSAENFCSTYSGKDKKEERKNGSSVYGWYGGEGAENPTPGSIDDPKLELVNGDSLYAQVTYSGTISQDMHIRLFIEGITSGAAGYYDMVKAEQLIDDGKFVLDDVTTEDKHFSQLKSRLTTEEGSPVFIPGEDIRAYVVAFDNSGPNKIGKSTTRTTNSLFAELTESSKDGVRYAELSIGSMRHLSNLYDGNSNMFYTAETGSATAPAFSVNAVAKDATKVKAVQIADLDWNSFIGSDDTAGNIVYDIVNIKNSDGTFDNNKSKHAGKSGLWLPISPSYPLEYDGDSHTISNVVVNYKDNAGLVGQMTGGSIANLALEDFQIESAESATANAGALAGALLATSSTASTGDLGHATDVTNVIAYNTSGYNGTENIKVSFKDGTGAAGGLIGYIKGLNTSSESGDVNACAASLYVNSTGNAGGLIGTIDGLLTVQGCYSGGHTENASYYYITESTNPETGETTVTKTGIYNVQGTAAVGGLVGQAGGASISASYSTCSASSGTGGTAGGLIGNGSGSITNCYATGLVEGQYAGAFAGSYTPSDESSCSGNSYYEIVNEREVSGAIGYLSAVSGAASTNGVSALDEKIGVSALDETITTYNAFCTGTADAYPYDDTLTTYYQKKYNLKSVVDLGYAIPTGTEYFIQDHHGDWPAPETFVINTAGGGAAGG